MFISKQEEVTSYPQNGQVPSTNLSAKNLQRIKGMKCFNRAPLCRKVRKTLNVKYHSKDVLWQDSCKLLMLLTKS